MVAEHVSSLNSLFSDMWELVPPGLFLSLAAGRIEKGKYWDVYIKEFIGSMMMIAFTFSAGKWVGTQSWEFAWACNC